MRMTTLKEIKLCDLDLLEIDSLRKGRYLKPSDYLNFCLILENPRRFTTLEPLNLETFLFRAKNAFSGLDYQIVEKGGIYRVKKLIMEEITRMLACRTKKLILVIFRDRFKFVMSYNEADIYLKYRMQRIERSFLGVIFKEIIINYSQGVLDQIIVECY